MKYLLCAIVVLTVAAFIVCSEPKTNLPEVEELMKNDELDYYDIVEVLEMRVASPKPDITVNREATKQGESSGKNAVIKKMLSADSLSVPESTYEEAVNHNSPPKQAAPLVTTEEPTVAAEPTVEAVTETEVQTESAVIETTEYVAEETTVTATEVEYNGTPLYGIVEPTGVNVLDENIQVFMYTELSKYGLERFMPYAIMIAYQESHFNPRAENPNGIDKGLLQYRIQYYPGSDIFNPYEQITIFCQQMSNRANIGCSVYEMISRHNTSDYGTYNQKYVNQVMQHESSLVRIK